MAWRSSTACASLAPDTKLIVMSGLMADCGGPPAPDFLGMMTNLKGIERLSKPFGRQDLLNLLPDSYIRRPRTKARARTEDFATEGRACITARPRAAGIP